MNRTILILAVAVILIGYDEAYACTCVSNHSPCRAFSESKAVFIGKVTGAAEQREETDQHGNRVSYDVGTIRFTITEAFLGAKGTQAVVHSGTGGGDCGYWFERGKTYLIYAYEDNGKLYTNICTRTRPVEQAEEDLSFLRNLPAKGTGGTLYGTVNKVVGDIEHDPIDHIEPMVGIKVKIVGDGRSFEVVTDEKGEYRKTSLPPGSYDVTLDLPANLGGFARYGRSNRFGNNFYNEKVGITDRGCVSNSFTVQSDGRIGGRITTGDGNPAKGISITLVKADSHDKSWQANTDAQGYYEFRMVQPGRYLLGINLAWVPDATSPYPRTYFPGVGDTAQSRIIGVGEGTRLQGYNMVLPPRLAERTVEGVVVWPDGRPADKAHIYYEILDYPGRSLPRSVESDGKGRFSVSLFDGQTYILYAEIDGSPDKPLHSEPVELNLDPKTESLRLILSKRGYGFESSREVKKRRTR